MDVIQCKASTVAEGREDYVPSRDKIGSDVDVGTSGTVVVGGCARKGAEEEVLWMTVCSGA